MFRTNWQFLDSGPTNGQNFRTGSYRGNAGRTDGFITWDLWEDMVAPGQVNGSGVTRGWRGPLTGVIASFVNYTGTTIPVEICALREITDGTSKTLLIGEYTNGDLQQATQFLGLHLCTVCNVPNCCAATDIHEFVLRW